MHITKMTKEDFEKVPYSEFDENIGIFNSLVIIPTGELHDSGFMCMDFVAVDISGEPIKRMSGSSDVIHIDGIGGLGKNWLTNISYTRTVPAKGWKIDVLPCGYMRLFCDSHIALSCGSFIVSDFEIYAHGIEME